MQDRNSGPQINSPVLYHLSHHQNFAGAFLWDSQSSKEGRKTFSWLFVPLSEISSQIKNPLLYFFAKLWNLGFCWKEEDEGKDKQRQKNGFFLLWNGKRNLDWDLTCSHSSCTHSLTHRIHTHTYTHSHTHTHLHTLSHTYARTHPHTIFYTNTPTLAHQHTDVLYRTLWPLFCLSGTRFRVQARDKSKNFNRSENEKVIIFFDT